MKKALKIAAVVALTSTGVAQAGSVDNYIEPFNLYDAEISGTVPGVKVRHNGETAIYQVGEHGLTRDVVFATDGDVRVAWAESHLGLTLTGDTYSKGESPN